MYSTLTSNLKLVQPSHQSDQMKQAFKLLGHILLRVWSEWCKTCTCSIFSLSLSLETILSARTCVLTQSCAQKGPILDSMLCCHLLEILNNSWKRGPAFLFGTGLCKLWSPFCSPCCLCLPLSHMHTCTRIHTHACARIHTRVRARTRTHTFEEGLAD